MRQLARTLSDEIMKAALAEEMKGPLVNELKKIQDERRPVLEDDYPWCNEIFVNHVEIPSHIKKLLEDREETLRQINDSRPKSKQQTLPRRRRKK